MGCGCNGDGKDENALYPIQVNDIVPHFSVSVFNPISQGIETLHFRPGKWTIIFFYPADFTFVCPTELADLAEKHEELKNLGFDVFGASTDTAFAHLMWLKTEKLLADVKYPMIADVKKEVSELFSVLDYESGLAMRGTYIINPDGKLIASEVVPSGVGRNADELVRKAEAIKLNYDNPNMVCPAKWKKGDQGLDKTKLVVGDVFNSRN